MSRTSVSEMARPCMRDRPGVIFIGDEESMTLEESGSFSQYDTEMFRFLTYLISKVDGYYTLD